MFVLSEGHGWKVFLVSPLASGSITPPVVYLCGHASEILWVRFLGEGTGVYWEMCAPCVVTAMGMYMPVLLRERYLPDGYEVPL